MRFMALAALLVGCGSDGGGDGPGFAGGNKSAGAAPEQHAMLVQDAAALPACDGASEGRLVYVKADGTFQACSAGAWAPIDLKGPKGDAGAAGAQGDPGAAGANGTDNRIISSITCNGILEDSVVFVSYSAALMASGDVFVSAGVKNALFQASGTQFYSAAQNGAAIGAVIITYDLSGDANGGFWVISLDRATLVVTAYYEDVDGNMSWSMTPDKCVGADY